MAQTLRSLRALPRLPPQKALSLDMMAGAYATRPAHGGRPHVPTAAATYVPRRQQQAQAAHQLHMAVTSEASDTIHRPIKASGSAAVSRQPGPAVSAC